MRNILLVDDDPDELDLFKSAIEEIPLELKVSYATNCDDLTSVLSKYNPDIIFMDINMPGLNGIDCLKLIRKKEAYKNLPIIMYSTSNNKKYIEQCYEQKANFYVVKSYTFDGITRAINRVLSKDWESIIPTPKKDFLIG
jgi:CheY-like chemotaxis protein